MTATIGGGGRRASSIPYYNWNGLPMWGTNITANNFKNSDVGKTRTGLAPYSQPWHKGYDAAGSALREDHVQRLLTFSNGNFSNPSFMFPLFIYELSIDFGITGSHAQSRFTRDMYPHNILIPSFTISGQCYDTASYGQLTEFIHYVQHVCLNPAEPLMQFYLQGNVYPNAKGPNMPATTHARKVTRHNKHTKSTTHTYNQKIIGQHEEIMCRGYIESITRQHQAGMHRPQWQIQFTVADMIKGPYQDSKATDAATHTWLAELRGTKTVNFTNAKDKKQNRGVIAYANANSANIVSNGGIN